MQENVIPFDFQGVTVRTFVESNGQIYFVARDVAQALGFKDAPRAIRQHTKGDVRRNIPTQGGEQSMRVITEGDVILLITKSRTGASREIVDWLLSLLHKNYVPVVHRDELVSLTTIEQLLGITLERQYPCGPYRIDGYHRESNTSYEIDEPAHAYQEDEDKIRQQFIEQELGCTFVRIKL